MTAETLTSVRAAASFPVFESHAAGLLCVAFGSFTITAAVEDGDIFEMCRVPASAIVIGGWLQTADLDTGTEVLDLMVGWAANGDEVADPNGFALADVFTGDASENYGGVGNLKFFGGVLATAGPKTFNRETLIQVEANTPANAGHTGIMTLVVQYLTP